MKKFSMAFFLSFVTMQLPAAEDFQMTVMDAFNISGGQLIVTGLIGSGSVATGDVVCLVRAKDGEEVEVTVGGIERFRKILDSASKGQHVGLLLPGIDKDDVAKGDTLRESC